MNNRVNRKEKGMSKDFILVVIGQIISLFGNAVLRFALPLHLLNVTDSPAVFGTVSALSFLPMLLMSPIGGVLADRINKKKNYGRAGFFHGRTDDSVLYFLWKMQCGAGDSDCAYTALWDIGSVSALSPGECPGSGT